ncbi:MAG: zinc-binding dehydrogenase [Acidimicrobiales bacterium]
MRAGVCSAIGAGLCVETLEEPRPRAGEVLIEVTTCGVCHTDLHVLKGEVAFPLPAVLGHEISGTVADVGEHVDGIRVGQRVVSSFIMPCGRCPRCVRGEEDLCETFFAMNRLRGTLYDGETRLYRPGGEPIAMYSMGGLAERCVVPETDVFAIPDELDLRDVATLGCSALTAYGAVRNVADLRAGQSVAVVAAGGVGSSIIQLASLFGASQIVAVDIADDKLEAARSLGATAVVNSRRDDPAAVVAQLTAGRGVDVAFEVLGSAATFNVAAGLVGDHGAVVVVGIAAAGAVGEIDLTRLPRRKLRILGSYGGRPRSDMPALVELVRRGQLAPQRAITRRYDLESADQAYSALDRGEIIGRAVIDVSP